MPPRGQSALGASGTAAGPGTAPAPRAAAGATPGLRGPRSAPWGPLNLLFAAICVLLPVLAGSAPATQLVEVHRHRAVTRRSLHTPWKGLCPPGTHLSEDGRNCIQCQSGVEYTRQWNALSSCLPCAVCNSDEDEISPCIRTRDTQCQCKPGTFLEEDVPEFCHKCKTRCPDGMVEASPCTPWGDLACVHRSTGCGERSSCMVLTNTWRFPRGPRSLDSVQNQMLSPSLTALDSAQETQGQEQAELPGAVAPKPVEAEPVLGQVKAQGSQTRKMELVPVHGADPIENLKLYFHYFLNLVPSDF
ncbi:tumor necrosis factor receptor superfamily member 10A-like isoform X2 [Tamandua tetradactyla]|uniref:tumor necrosis factor receptor superfamily member 10A-like isoform X2 n=1 Tax=Tamandua tetradactyla TaxID=48850 RepID=UPI0040542878